MHGCAIEATRCPLVSHMMNNSHHTFVHTFYYLSSSVLVCINLFSVYTRSRLTYRNTTIAITQYQCDYQFMFSMCSYHGNALEYSLSCLSLLCLHRCHLC